MLTHKFLLDETGFIVSAELILVATILVIGMIVGLSEVQHSVTAELNDVADAVGSVNQSYYYSGFSAYKNFGRGIKSLTTGSAFLDSRDDCDYNQCSISCENPVAERPQTSRSYCSPAISTPDTCSAACAKLN